MEALGLADKANPPKRPPPVASGAQGIMVARVGGDGAVGAMLLVSSNRQFQLDLVLCHG